MTKKELINEQQWKLFVLMLKGIAKKKGISQDVIAEKVNVIRSNISRTMNLNHEPKLGLFLSICDAIGVNFFFEDKDSLTDLSQIFEAAMTELGRRPDKMPKN
jgi:DNA-binding phage protein